MDTNRRNILDYTEDQLFASKSSNGPTRYHRILTHLANHPISPDLDITQPLPPLEFGDLIARKAIADLLATNLAPICTRKDHNFERTKGGKIERLPTCSDAEIYFTETFDSMQVSVSSTGQEGLGYDVGWTIITDYDNEPIAIKKQRGEPSALSLVPFTISGNRFPAGSLLTMKVKGHPDHDALSLRGRFTMPHESVTGVRVLRLSAFAHELKERRLLFEDMNLGSPSACLSLDDITELAVKYISSSK